MADDRHDEDPRQAETSQAARTPLALHEDALSPARVVREHSGAEGGEGSSQRIGNTGATGPTVSFPGPEPEAPDPADASPSEGGRTGGDAPHPSSP